MTNLSLDSMPESEENSRSTDSNSVAIGTALESSSPSSSHPVPLGEAIKRGWDWLVFTWSMLRRLGGFREIVQTFATVILMLVKRTLIQWGLLRKG